MKNNLFEKTLSIIEHAETELTRSPRATIQIFDKFNRHLVYPINHLCVGFQIGLNDFLKFSVVYIGLFLFVVFFSKNLPNTDKDVFLKSIYPIIFLIPLLVSIFPIPSTNGFYGVKTKGISTIKKFLNIINIDSVDELVIIRENVEIFDTKQKRRVIFLKGALTLAFAVYVYFGKILFEQFLKEKNQQTFNDIIELSVYPLFVLLFAIAVESYNITNNLIFKTIYVQR